MNRTEPCASTAQQTVLVFEKRPRWTPELRRQLPDAAWKIRTVGTAVEIVDAVREKACDVIVLDLDSSPGECLQTLGRLGQLFEAPPVIVIASRRTAELEFVARDLGATSFLLSPGCGDALAARCRRLGKPRHRTPAPHG